MSARQEISIKKLGIIAGGGGVPRQLQEACNTQNIETYIVGFKDYTDQVTPDYWGRIGASGKIISALKSAGITDLVMIGAIKRPSLFDMWPDWITFKFLWKAWVKSFGDSGLLSAARGELEQMGFRLHGVHKFLPHLLMGEGVLGHEAPKDGHQMDVQIGIAAARELGAQDIGQAVLVKDGQVIAREDSRGTNAMIKRFGTDGAILVKMCKPQQDMDLDLPTLGTRTVKLCAERNMSGIVGQAGSTLLVERDAVQKAADAHGLFILGVTIN